jgi:sporulation protein YlmC with PRC-barrel domain
MAENAAPRAEILRTRDFVGWDVLDVAGARIGKVDELLLDRGGVVRYLDVDLGLFRRHVLLPISQVDWSEGAMMSRWSKEQLSALPSYDPSQPLTTGVLDELRRAHPRFYGDGAEAPLAAPGEARVVPLSEAKDFKLAGGAPDLRGWNVFAADRQRVGTVKDMLVDPAAMRVEFLAVDLADDLFSLKEDRHVLIPTEAVDLQERGNDVWIRGVDTQEVARLPAYTGGPVDPLVEERVREAFRGGSRGEAPRGY